VRPNLDSLVHKLGAAVAMMVVVVEDVEGSVADLAAAAWVLVLVAAAAVVKSTSPTFVTSLLCYYLVGSAELTLNFSSLTL